MAGRAAAVAAGGAGGGSTTQIMSSTVSRTVERPIGLIMIIRLLLMRMIIKCVRG